MLSVGDKSVSFAVLVTLFILPVMFGVVVRAEDEKSCFTEKEGNVEYTGDCLASEVTLRVPATEYTAEFSFTGKDIPKFKKVNFTAGGCKFDGKFSEVDSGIAGLMLDDPKGNVQFPATLTVSKEKAAEIVGLNKVKLTATCTSSEFVKKEGGKYTTDFAIDLAEKLPGLTVIIKGASDRDEQKLKDAAATAGISLGLIGIICSVSGVLLVVLIVGIILFVCLRRRRKQREANAAREAEAHVEAAQLQTALERSPTNQEEKDGPPVLPACGEDKSKNSKVGQQYAAIDPQETTVEKKKTETEQQKKQEEKSETEQQKKEEKSETEQQKKKEEPKQKKEAEPVVVADPMYHPLSNKDRLDQTPEHLIPGIVRDTPADERHITYFKHFYADLAEHYDMIAKFDTPVTHQYMDRMKKVGIVLKELHLKLHPDVPISTIQIPEEMVVKRVKK